MVRFLFRFLGLVTLAAAFIFFVYDGTRSIAAGHLALTKVSDAWSAIDQASLLALQKQHVAMWLWDPVLQALLEQPAWLVLVVLGAILVLLGRKKKPLIGYSR
jgi:hypothetical protein